MIVTIVIIIITAAVSVLCFAGAVYGLVFPLVCSPGVFVHFLEKMGF